MQVEISTAYAVFIVANVLLPVVVAFVTKQNTLGKYKAYVLLALSAVSAGVLELQQAGTDGFDWKTWLVGIVIAFVTAAASHSGLLKPTGVTGSKGVVQEKVPAGIV